VCFNTQELQFYFAHFCFTEQVIPHWIAEKRERIAAKKKLNGNCCLILHRNQVVITQTSLQMYCHLTCPN
jgi:hypothetical protein